MGIRLADRHPFDDKPGDIYWNTEVGGIYICDGKNWLCLEQDQFIWLKEKVTKELETKRLIIEEIKKKEQEDRLGLSRYTEILDD